MFFIQLLIHFIEYLLFAYFSFAAIYVFIFSIASIFKRKSVSISIQNERKIAVLIPGYKEDNVICKVAELALQQEYPTSKFDVIIIADSFQQSTIECLKKMPITLIEVSFEVSTKSKALNKAMETLSKDYDIAVILDADNVMEHNFLTKINEAFEAGFQIVQGHRVAKNTNTSFAVLDAISEELNNSIFRKGHRVLGFSSALIGSGMAFNYKMFKSRMRDIKAIGGFDKELELTLLRDGHKIEYLEHALVFDEKVQKIEVFENQRKRWLSAQFIYFGRFFKSGLKSLLLKGNIDFFDKVYQMISPPRILLIGISALITIFYTLFNIVFPQYNVLNLSYRHWLLVLISIIFAYFISIPLKFYNVQTLRALMTLPSAFLSMFLSLFKLKGANKKFIHTQHGS